MKTALEELAKLCPVEENSTIPAQDIFPEISEFQANPELLQEDLHRLRSLISQSFKNQILEIPYQVFYELARPPASSHNKEYRKKHRRPATAEWIVEINIDSTIEHMFTYTTRDFLPLGIKGKELRDLKKIAREVRKQWKQQKIQVPSRMEDLRRLEKECLEELESEYESLAKIIEARSKTGALDTSVLNSTMPVGLVQQPVNVVVESTKFWQKLNTIQLPEILTVPIHEVLSYDGQDVWVLTSGMLMSAGMVANYGQQGTQKSEVAPFAIGKETHVLSSINAYPLPDELFGDVDFQIYRVYALGNLTKVDESSLGDFFAILETAQSRETVFGGRVVGGKYLIDTMATPENLFLISIKTEESLNEGRIKYKPFEHMVYPFDRLDYGLLKSWGIDAKEILHQ